MKKLISIENSMIMFLAVTIVILFSLLLMKKEPLPAFVNLTLSEIEEVYLQEGIEEFPITDQEVYREIAIFCHNINPVRLYDKGDNQYHGVTESKSIRIETKEHTFILDLEKKYYDFLKMTTIEKKDSMVEEWLCAP